MIESLSLLGGLSLVFFRKRRSRSPAEKSPEAWLPRLVLFLCVCLLIKSAVTCAVLKPWHRYALEYLVLFFVVAAYLLRSVRLSQSPWAAVVAFGIALACPSHAHLPFTAEQMWPGQQNGSIREVVDFLRSNELKTRPVRLFSENAFAVYSGNLDFETWQSFEESPYRDRKDLRGFLSEKGVNILVVDAVMDFRLNELKANVADLGFRPLKTFGSGTRIYQWQESSTEPSR